MKLRSTEEIRSFCDRMQRIQGKHQRIQGKHQFIRQLRKEMRRLRTAQNALWDRRDHDAGMELNGFENALDLIEEFLKPKRTK